MRSEPIRLIIDVGRGLRRRFVSNNQIYGCLKQERVMQTCPPSWLICNLIKKRKKENVYYIRSFPPQQPVASRSSGAHSWMAATLLDHWPDLSEGSSQSRWAWKAATVNSRSVAKIIAAAGGKHSVDEAMCVWRGSLTFSYFLVL